MLTESRLKKIRHAVSHRQQGLIMVVEDVHDPHNAEAILRTCDAYGVQNVYFIFDQEKPYEPGSIGKSSSSSANKWLDYTIFSSAKECLNALKKQGYTSYGLILDTTARSIYDTNFLETDHLALWVGNEHRGLSQTAIKGIKKHVYIPMRGMVQSLNVSVTAAICLFEVTRQRHEAGKDFSLSLKEQQVLERDFSLRKSKQKTTQ